MTENRSLRGTRMDFRKWLAAAAFVAACAASAHAQSAREELAPTGKLRIGVYPGSPSSMLQDAKTGETHGVTVEVGEALAAKLGVGYVFVTFPRVAEVVDALRNGAVDFTVTNATPARAEIVDFGPHLLALELGYLVPAGSPLQTLADVEKPGVRIGVTEGSSSQRALPKRLPQAKFAAAPSVKDAIALLRNGEIDAFATNKGILFEMADQAPGSHVLDGAWGAEHMAAAIPKGRAHGLEFLAGFSDEARSSGLVAQAAERAGLRGLAKD